MALEEIVERKRVDVERRQREVPLETFRGQLNPSTRSLEKALRQPHTGFIMECKRSSPSQGQIREHFDPASIARSYAPFADAISVLTDEPFFDGQLEYIEQVRQVVDVPVLCKDFVVAPYQVFEARHFGADAILLMLSVLDDDTYAQCFEAARSLGLDVLTEVHDAEELDRALRHPCKPPIIGVNNRNLKTLEIDLSTLDQLGKTIPSDRVIVCESGIGGHRDVVGLRAGCDAFLVGTTLMRAPDIDQAARRLVFGDVKVCGLTRPQDARAAWEAGACRGGLIFAEESPRSVDVEQAMGIVEAAPMEFVGVFVNAPIAQVVELADQLGLDAVQLHGEEDNTYIAELRPHLAPVTEVWQVHRVDSAVPDLATLQADRVLLDTFEPQRRGGTGRSFDWSLLDAYETADKVVLSGGLSPDNAARADRIGAAILDVNSGVEHAPGIKSDEQLSQFFAALRGNGRDV